jgi:hypothetical protein
MTERERARRAADALKRITEALASLEYVAYEGNVHPDENGDDELWSAIDRFNSAYYHALEVTLYTFDGELIPSPLAVLEKAVNARL